MCRPDVKVTCKVLTDNYTDKVFVDGTLVVQSNNNGHSGITFDVPDCATSVTIQARDFEKGCKNGGSRLTCSGTSRWSKVNSDGDRKNWRIDEGYVTGAEAKSSTAHLSWPKASESTGGHASPGMCGLGNKWTFRRDMPGGIRVEHTY